MSLRQRVTPYKNLDVDENGVVVASAPRKIRYFYVYNTAVTEVYLKVYDKATAPTNADTPIHTFPIPARAGAVLNAVSSETPFEDGIGLRATTGIADNDTGAPAANQVIVNLGIVENLDYTL